VVRPPQQDAQGPWVREHEALVPHDVQNERNGHGGRCSDASAQRQRSRRSIKNARLATAERDQILRHNGPAGKESESGTHGVWKGPGQRVKRAALIVQVERAMMVIGIRIDKGRLVNRMMMRINRHCLINIERVIVEQRNDTCNLRRHEQRQQRQANPAHGSQDCHRLWMLPSESYARHGTPACGKRATALNYLRKSASSNLHVEQLVTRTRSRPPLSGKSAPTELRTAHA
jgi:hypothetical protein